MRSAFAIGELWPVLLSGSFAAAWLRSLGVLAIGLAIGVPLLFVPFAFFLGGFVAFYTAVAMAYCYTHGFTAVRPLAQEPEPGMAEHAA